MQGNNTMELNEATMIAALQFWLDSQFRENLAPKVTAVSFSGNGYTSKTFKVETTDRDSAAV